MIRILDMLELRGSGGSSDLGLNFRKKCRVENMILGAFQMFRKILRLNDSAQGECEQLEQKVRDQQAEKTEKYCKKHGNKTRAE